MGRGSGRGGRSRTSGGGGGAVTSSPGAAPISAERRAQIERRATIGTRLIALGALALLTFLTRGRRV
jgi:hypothetical protein